MKPKVTLLSWTNDPVGTLFKIWTASRTDAPLVTDAEMCVDQIRFEARELFLKIIDSDIPVAENIDFVFMLENVSISFREQMVRHRVGVHVGDRLGCDMIPDLSDSCWWSQSMRILNMENFARNNCFRVPENLTLNQAVDFDNHMFACAELYKKLVDAGVPMEEAREVIPLAATHRITWKVNLAALKHIIGKRGCWVLQSGLWAPVINGMIEELCSKIDGVFRNLICPPCIKHDKFKGCLFCLDNERRVRGIDNLPPCSLYLHEEAMPQTHAHDVWKMDRKGNERVWHSHNVDTKKCMDEMIDAFRKLWKRNPCTGKRLSTATPPTTGKG